MQTLQVIRAKEIIPIHFLFFIWCYMQLFLFIIFKKPYFQMVLFLKKLKILWEYMSHILPFAAILFLPKFTLYHNISQCTLNTLYRHRVFKAEGPSRFQFENIDGEKFGAWEAI